MHDASDGTPGRRGLFLVGDPSAAGSEGVWQAVGQSLEVWALGEAPTVCGSLEAWGVAVHRAPLRSETAEAPAAVAASMREIARERSLDLDRSFLVTDRPEVLEVLGTTGGTGILVWEGEGPDPRGEVGEGVVVLPGLADALPTLREGKPDAEDTALARAARRIRHGGIVAFPTETVYGLGANALHPRAVARIFQVKRRPFFDPLIVHLEDRAWVDRLARQVPSGARRLMDRFWPGPLTLVLPRTPLVPDLVTAGLDTVGLRMPAHPMARDLIRASGVPICAPSANPFGYVSPTRPEHVVEQLGGEVDCVLDGGPCAIGIESTIVAFEGDRPVVLRPGAVTAEDLQSVLGIEPILGAPEDVMPLAPGRLPRHYSPSVPVRLFRGEVPPPPSPESGLVLLRPRPVPEGYRRVEWLSRDGDLAAVAHHLFEVLRRLDGSSLDVVVAEVPPEEGLGRAIADRLRRAAARG